LSILDCDGDCFSAAPSAPSVSSLETVKILLFLRTLWPLEFDSIDWIRAKFDLDSFLHNIASFLDAARITAASLNWSAPTLAKAIEDDEHCRLLSGDCTLRGEAEWSSNL
jgi:hypothetical protein